MLGVIEREVSALDQRRAIAAVVGEPGDADRFRDREPAFFGLDDDYLESLGY